MAVDDLWYLRNRDPATRKPLPSKRHGRGKRWRVRWVDPEDGTPRVQLFERKADADRLDANMRADISRGQYIDPKDGRLTVAEYAGQWRAQQVHIDSTFEMVERAFRLHIIPVIGGLPMASVRASHLRNWVKDRSALTKDGRTVLAASTMHLVFGYISAMFADAVVDRVIGSTPCVGIKLPEIPRSDRFIPTPNQVHLLAAGVPERYRAGAYIAAGCGLRFAEIVGLELEHVDFLRREITVVQQLRQRAGGPAYIGLPKTKTSIRTGELPSVVADALAWHIQRFPLKVLEMEDRTDLRKPVTRPVKLLFTTPTGLPVQRSSWSDGWKPAVDAVEGIPAGFGVHGLRHYFATLLIHGGASVKTVQMALGHSSPSITLDTYTHEWPEALDRTRALVDAALGPAPAARDGVAL